VEHECWLPHSQEPATCPYPHPDQFMPYPHPTSLRSILILLPIYYYHQRKTDADVYHLIPSLPFAWTLLIAYSKAKLQSNGNETSLIHAVPLKITLRCNLQQSHPFTRIHCSGCGLVQDWANNVRVCILKTKKNVSSKSLHGVVISKTTAWVNQFDCYLVTNSVS